MRMRLEMTDPIGPRSYASYKCQNCGEQHSSSTTEILCQTDFNSIAEPKDYTFSIRRDASGSYAISKGNMTGRIFRYEDGNWKG